MTHPLDPNLHQGLRQPYRRRQFAGMLATLPFMASGARAQSRFPEKPINLIVP